MTTKILSQVFKKLNILYTASFHLFGIILLGLIVLFEISSFTYFKKRSEIVSDLFSQKIESFVAHIETSDFTSFVISGEGKILKSPISSLNHISIAGTPLFQSFSDLQNHAIILQVYPSLIDGKTSLYITTRKNNLYLSHIISPDKFFPLHVRSHIFLATDSRGICIWSSNPNLIGLKFQSGIQKINNHSRLLTSIPFLKPISSLHLYAVIDYQYQVFRFIIALLVAFSFFLFLFYILKLFRTTFRELDYEYKIFKDLEISLGQIKNYKSKSYALIYQKAQTQIDLVNQRLKKLKFQFQESKQFLILIRTQNNFIKNLLSISQNHINSLKKKEKDLKLLIFSARKVAFITLEFDPALMDFIISSFSEGAEDLFGYTHSEVLSDSLFEYLISPSDPFYETLIYLTKSRNNYITGELIIRSRENIKKDISYSIQKVSLDKNSKEKSLFLTLVDITLLKKTHSQLYKEKEKVQNLLTNIREGVILLNEKKEIQYANTQATQILNQPLEKLLYQPINRFYQVREYTNLIDNTKDERSWKIVGKDSVNYRKAKLLQKNQNPVFILEKVSLIYDEKDEVETIILILDTFGEENQS